MGITFGDLDALTERDAADAVVLRPRRVPAPGRIHFKCPSCSAQHDRGFIDGVNTFRCLGCGYLGHGFHTDPAVDRALLAEHESNNALHRELGIPEVPLGVDPQDFVS